MSHTPEVIHMNRMKCIEEFQRVSGEASPHSKSPESSMTGGRPEKPVSRGSSYDGVSTLNVDFPQMDLTLLLNEDTFKEKLLVKSIELDRINSDNQALADNLASALERQERLAQENVVIENKLRAALERESKLVEDVRRLESAVINSSIISDILEEESSAYDDTQMVADCEAVFDVPRMCKRCAANILEKDSFSYASIEDLEGVSVNSEGPIEDERIKVMTEKIQRMEELINSQRSEMFLMIENMTKSVQALTEGENSERNIMKVNWMHKRLESFSTAISISRSSSSLASRRGGRGGSTSSNRASLSGRGLS
jgi:hypothetical protein